MSFPVSSLGFFFVATVFSLNQISGGDGLSHALFDSALKKHVRDGLVDYQAMSKDQDFIAYLGKIKSVNIDDLSERNEALAFWINAYNALAIKGVINNMPLEKVIEVEGFFNKNKHAVAGVKYTLDQIEKEIIFPRFKEARLHFVLVCAARSCPALPASAYTAENVESRLQDVTRQFLNNPEKNRYDREKRTLYLSQIFNWYQADFGGSQKSLIGFIKPYLNEEVRGLLEDPAVRVEFLPYDWTLNAQMQN